MNLPAFATDCMQRALELARRGQGYVEPNPMVGCVIARDDRIVGEGWHPRFGGPHAEIEALRAAGNAARNATLYVTLEPCCHHGKTPPCTDAILAAGIRRVVVAQEDPFPEVAGRGMKILRQAGIDVDAGLLQAEAQQLNAPYRKLVATNQPWIIAKWAMTLDGKIATISGDSCWISNESSRRIVHEIRGRVDAILVGSGTAHQDDPLLTARPAGPRTATRIVLDSNASLAPDSRLVSSLHEAPVLVAASPQAPSVNVNQLLKRGCEVVTLAGNTPVERLRTLLDELGSRRMTNVLVEGGSTVLGTFFDAEAIDEVHVFIAPKTVGGSTAPTAIGGRGVDSIAGAMQLASCDVEPIDGDVYLHGPVQR